MDLDTATSIIKTEVNNLKRENKDLDEYTIKNYIKEIEMKLANIEVYRVEMLELSDNRRDVRKVVREYIEECFQYLIASWRYFEHFSSHEKCVFYLEEQDRIEKIRQSVYT